MRCNKWLRCTVALLGSVLAIDSGLAAGTLSERGVDKSSKAVVIAHIRGWDMDLSDAQFSQPVKTRGSDFRCGRDELFECPYISNQDRSGDYEKALAWHLGIASQRSSRAMLQVGIAPYNASGVERDVKKALFFTIVLPLY